MKQLGLKAFIVATSIFFGAVGNVPNHIVAKTNKIESLSFAHRGETDVDNLLDTLSTESPSPIYLTNHYSSYYFDNLNSNFGNNSHGTCSYVSMGMLLSFYDSYWDDAFIDNRYDVGSEFQSNRQYLADFDLIPSAIESPGVLFESRQLVDGLSIQDYYGVVSLHSDTYFQFKLIEIAKSLFGDNKFDESSDSLGLNRTELSNVLSTYLNSYAHISDQKATVQSYFNEDEQLMREAVVRQIKDGVPVILRAKEPTTNTCHSMIAYDYDENADEIYVHTGWRDETRNVALTHVALSKLPYNNLLDITYLGIKPSFSHSHAFHYHSSLGDNLCACSYVYPREIELVQGNFNDALPTFRWMSLYNEKWFSNYFIRTKLSILDCDRVRKNFAYGINSTEYTLTQELWDSARFETKGKTYNVFLEIQASSDTLGFDGYWCRREFNKPVDYERTPYIKPAEYGYEDAYPSDEATATTFTEHQTRNGGSFKTRRYRAGYIHNEYIVLSPRRKGFDHAFIEYSFEKTVNRIDVQLSHWREFSKEKLDKTNGKAEIQFFYKGEWVTQLDLLADSTGLPRDRNRPNLYQVWLDRPTYKVRFYSEIYDTAVNADSNLGRICIGDLAYYEIDPLPLSGYELKYNPSVWRLGNIENNNCYAYILNNQMWPGTNEFWKMQQPGDYSGERYVSCTKTVLEEAVMRDFSKYNEEFGTSLMFQEVGKYATTPSGTYKVALAVSDRDYHWYRQDSNGHWSHKPCRDKVRRTDESGNLIVDPELCDRGSYVNFLGFYALTPWNHLFYD